MKLVLTLAILSLILGGCGYQRTLRTHCHIGDTQTCDNLFGVNQEERDAQQDKEIESLQTMINELIKDVRVVEQQAAQTNSMINMLNLLAQQQGADIASINQMLSDMHQDLATLEDKIAYEQTRINGLAIDVANLGAQDAVIESVYPCGDAPNKFDEALLRTRSGKLIAYFESSGNRFLTELTQGTYRTTDYAPYCNFTVNAQKQIVGAGR